jgi:hypothetical protein
MPEPASQPILLGVDGRPVAVGLAEPSLTFYESAGHIGLLLAGAFSEGRLPLALHFSEVWWLKRGDHARELAKHDEVILAEERGIWRLRVGAGAMALTGRVPFMVRFLEETEWQRLAREAEAGNFQILLDLAAKHYRALSDGERAALPAWKLAVGKVTPRKETVRVTLKPSRPGATVRISLSAAERNALEEAVRKGLPAAPATPPPLTVGHVRQGLWRMIWQNLRRWWQRLFARRRLVPPAVRSRKTVRISLPPKNRPGGLSEGTSSGPWAD